MLEAEKGGRAPDGLDLVDPVRGRELVEARKEVVQEPGGPCIGAGGEEKKSDYLRKKRIKHFALGEMIAE